VPTIPPGLGEQQSNWPPLAAPRSAWVMPGWGTTIGRGIAGNCPHCGNAPIFNGYLRVNETCAACAAPLGQMPADDTPPYIAMVVVLHFVGLFTVLSFRWRLHPNAIEIGLLLVLLVLVCMAALRMAKGAVIGILLKLDNNREKPDG
jgi:uncharacterized protein (DUF983 family)